MVCICVVHRLLLPLCCYRYPIDPPVKVRELSGVGPPPLPQALRRPQVELERRGTEERPQPHSSHPSHSPSNEQYEEDKVEDEQEVPRPSMPGQGYRLGSGGKTGGHRFPAHIQNGTPAGPQSREPSPRRMYPPQVTGFEVLCLSASCVGPLLCMCCSTFAISCATCTGTGPW